MTIGGRPVEDGRVYRVATNSFMAEGGDLYQTFTEGKWIETVDKDIAEVVVEHLKEQPGPVPAPEMDRLIPVSK